MAETDDNARLAAIKERMAEALAFDCGGHFDELFLLAEIDRLQRERDELRKAVGSLPYLSATPEMMDIYRETAQEVKAGDGSDPKAIGQMMLQLVAIARDGIKARQLVMVAAANSTDAPAPG